MISVLFIKYNALLVKPSLVSEKKFSEEEWAKKFKIKS